MLGVNFKEVRKNKYMAQPPSLTTPISDLVELSKLTRDYSLWLLRLHHHHDPKIEVKVPSSYILVYFKSMDTILR